MCKIEGCERPKWAKQMCIKHYKQEWKHPLYSTWDAMKQRCSNPNNAKYRHYGGRGIKVCERWLTFSSFLEDVGEKPSPKHTLDRIDNDGDYERANVRWATQREQNFNQRLNRRNTSGFTGVSFDKDRKAWTVRMKVDGRYKFFGYYATKAEAVEIRKEVEKLWQ